MWQLKLFGGFKLEGGETLSGRAAQRKRQALLALLGSGPSTQISRDKIVALLWPESDSERARHQLASSLYDTRQVLGDEGLLATGDDLRLNPEIVRSDVREFEAAIEQADYTRATALRSGSFLDGFHVAGAPDFERWVDAERERLDRLFSQALEKAAAEFANRGDAAGTARWLQQLVTHEPYNSRLALLYMDALAKSGDVAGARRYGRTHELLMQQELGATADPQIGAFVDQLRSRAAQPAQLADAPASTGTDDVVESATTNVVPHERALLQRRVVGTAAVSALIVAAFTLYAWPDDPPERSIAVLPFSTISAGQDSTYIADGVHEDLLAHLTKIANLKVIAHVGNGVPR